MHSIRFLGWDGIVYFWLWCYQSFVGLKRKEKFYVILQHTASYFHIFLIDWDDGIALF